MEGIRKRVESVVKLFSLSWGDSVYSQRLWQIPEIPGHGFCFELLKFWSIWCLCQEKALFGCRGLADATTQTALITQQGEVIISREIILGNKLEEKQGPSQAEVRAPDRSIKSFRPSQWTSQLFPANWLKKGADFTGTGILVTITPKTLTPVRLPHCHQEFYWIYPMHSHTGLWFAVGFLKTRSLCLRT